MHSHSSRISRRCRAGAWPRGSARATVTRPKMGNRQRVPGSPRRWTAFRLVARGRNMEADALARTVLRLLVLAAVVVIGLAGWRVLMNRRYVAGLHAQLRSPRPNERAQAVEALARPIDVAPDVEVALHALRTDPSSEVRRVAASALGTMRIGGSSLSEAESLRIYTALLRATTEDPSADVRAAAVSSAWNCFAEFKKRSTRDFLSRVSRTSDPVLRKARYDPDSVVRAKAERMLERLKGLSGHEK